VGAWWHFSLVPDYISTHTPFYALEITPPSIMGWGRPPGRPNIMAGS